MNGLAAPLSVLSGWMSSTAFYSSVVFLHALAAIVLMGGSLHFALTRSAIRSAGTVEELRGWLAFDRRASATHPAAALVLLTTGIYLGAQGWWTEPWFLVAVAVFLFDALYAARRARLAAEALAGAAAGAAPGPVPEPLHRLRWSCSLDVPHDLLLASDLAMLFVMFAKPGLVASCAALLVANGVLTAMRRRRRRPEASGVRTAAALATRS